jgi:hypothetical protein
MEQQLVSLFARLIGRKQEDSVYRCNNWYMLQMLKPIRTGEIIHTTLLPERNV